MSVLSIHSISSTKLKLQEGFSLIELVVVIVIMGVLVAIAAPNVNAALDNQRNKQTTSALISAFREARTESQLRRQDVSVVVDHTNSVIKLTIPSIPTPTTIREFAYHQNTSIGANSDKVIFKSNKIVVGGSSASTLTDFSYTVTCNKKKSKVGSTVNVDNNGNVQIDNGASRC